MTTNEKIIALVKPEYFADCKIKLNTVPIQ